MGIRTDWVATGFLLALLLHSGCSFDNEVPASTNSDATDTSAVDAGTESGSDVALEVAPIDVTDEQNVDDMAVGDGLYGQPCQSNADCVSGMCVSSSLGFVCTQLCTSDCPPIGEDTMTCQRVTNFGADDVYVCTPQRESICEPCLDDRNCFDGACVDLPSGQICGRDCVSPDDCPDGTFCYEVIPGVGDLAVPQCLPNNLTCDCDAENDAETRQCVRSNDDDSRTCIGQETCDTVLGWVGCDAPEPQPEACNGFDDDCNGAIDDGLELFAECEISTDGIDTTCPGVRTCAGEPGWECVGQAPTEELCDLFDNDCDGDVDETFITIQDGGEIIYDRVTDCGVCGNNCADRFPADYESACQIIEGEAMCVITACPTGYTQSGLTACVPLNSMLCSPCLTDLNCNHALGDACITYDDGNMFCGRDCGTYSVFTTSCPAGYECNGASQCELITGNCVCGDDDSFFLPCQVVSPTDPGTICSGTQECDDGTLLDCTPPTEVCDGLDNDCDGPIDEEFTDAFGFYTTDTDCGRCFNDCTLMYGVTPLEELNADGGECDSTGDPVCVPSCDDGYENPDGLDYNGCECQCLVGGDTCADGVDDPDPEGIDADCDGIDGDWQRAVFVAPDGAAGAAGTRVDPLNNIGEAILQAASGDFDYVLVAGGVYNESFMLAEGISVYGGYSFDFSSRDIEGNETAILGNAPTTAACPGVTDEGTRCLGAVNADGILTDETIFEGFTLVGFDQTEEGASSYAIHITDCNAQLKVRNNVIWAGNGGNRGPGGRGDPGGSAAPWDGDPLLDPFTPSGRGLPPIATAGSVCLSSETVPGGTGAQFSCAHPVSGPDVETDGGDGGTAVCPIRNSPGATGGVGLDTPGGSGFDPDSAVCAITCTSDGDCGDVINYSCDTMPDDALRCRPNSGTCGGDGGVGGYPTYWRTYNAGDPPEDDCYWCVVPNGAEHTIEGLDGKNGFRGDVGVAGAGCSPTSGEVVDGEWFSTTLGSAGGRGGPGSGGGGGGAGGGVGYLNRSAPDCVSDYEVVGGGGGGGGAGGCGGDGGIGGESAGGSFGVLLVFEGDPGSLPTIDDNTIHRGRGGDGGAGGAGGDGGYGSVGNIGTPGFLNGCSGPGGRGGDGGPGGPGGGGGGGCGGPSVGIQSFGHGGYSLAPYDADNTFTPSGAAGQPGAGGPSSGEDGLEADAAPFERVLP